MVRLPGRQHGQRADPGPYEQRVRGTVRAHTAGQPEGVGAFQPLLQALVREPRILGLLKTLRLAAPSLHEQLFRDLALEYSNMDFRLYIAILLALAEHDAHDVLPTIAVPTLIITGQRDFFTPPGLARRMADRIAGAELLEVKLGTHYTPVEFPDVVNLRLKKFFRDHAL